ncbi:hypothetical protein Q5P01_007197 [Channa striata]|uniref:Uncharacterized protein n=1 Tax=Channa striata TaxID=64152 RepID=A0AA88NBH4_CHASR|nr:hypothetical protein Q5P01_007197 [Channa striata]
MSNKNQETRLCPIGNKLRKKAGRETRRTGAEPSSDLQKQSTKHLNVSLKNRMGTDAHGGDGGLLNTERTTRSRRVSAHRAAASSGAGGGRALQRSRTRRTGDERRSPVRNEAPKLR